MPTLDRKLDFYGLTPVEISVPKGGKSSRERALGAYIKTMEFAFTGVSNRVNSVIDELTVGKDWCGSVTKKGDSIDWNLVAEASDVIVYNISVEEIQENMYLADSVNIGKDNKLTPVWSKNLFETNGTDTKGKFVTAIEAFSEYIDKYKLVWDNKLKLLNSNGKVVNMDDISEDDIYILLKLMTLIFKKGKHTGVFFINCAGFNDKTLNAMMSFIKGVYGDAFVFLYNCKYTHVKRELLELPNLCVKEGASR